MTNHTAFFAGLVALAASTGAHTYAAANADEPVFIAGGQYTATLDQRTRQWRLLPMDGRDVEVASPAGECTQGPAIPKGVWLVTRNVKGRPELLAPSVTPLPAGHSDRVQLLACGESGDGSPSLAVPPELIEWLSARAGAVYIDG